LVPFLQIQQKVHWLNFRIFLSHIVEQLKALGLLQTSQKPVDWAVLSFFAIIQAFTYLYSSH